MKTDDDENPPRFQTIMQHAIQGGRKLLELLVDGDPQRLEDARRGVAASDRGPAAARR